MPQPADVYLGLRSRALTVDPKDIGLEPSDAVPNVWGMLMEFRISGTVVTLLSLADGTTSLYFSNGGGIIGGGQHEEVAGASRDFIALAESFFNDLAPATEYPLPSPNRVKFYFMTFSGAYTADVDQDELVEHGNSLSPLYYAGNDVITQVRLHTPQDQ
jgi:hypothetical protein